MVLISQLVSFVFVYFVEFSCSKHATDHHKSRSFKDTLTLLNHIQITLSREPYFQQKYRDKHNSDTPGQVLYANRIFHTEILNIENSIGSPNPQQTSSILSLFKPTATTHKFHQLPILIWEMTFPGYAVGNHLGAYFDTIGCAHKIGAHFIGLTPDYPQNELFYKAFPTIIPHMDPLRNVTYENMLSQIQAHCPCRSFCWREKQPWESIIPKIRTIMQDAVRFKLISPHNGVFPEYHSLSIELRTDVVYQTCKSSKSVISVSESGFHQYLPLFPDVAIQYRCSDNLYAGMGCLSFSSILTRIPRSAKYIYIFSEMIDTSDNSTDIFPMAEKAIGIINALVQDIATQNPDATIVLKRDSHVFVTMSIFGSAEVTICSPSTFCFYPALSRDKLTYFPVGEGQYINISESTHIHSNFHILRGSNLFYKNFTSSTSLRDILLTLRSSS